MSVKIICMIFGFQGSIKSMLYVRSFSAVIDTYGAWKLRKDGWFSSTECWKLFPVQLLVSFQSSSTQWNQQILQLLYDSFVGGFNIFRSLPCSAQLFTLSFQCYLLFWHQLLYMQVVSFLQHMKLVFSYIFKYKKVLQKLFVLFSHFKRTVAQYFLCCKILNKFKNFA